MRKRRAWIAAALVAVVAAGWLIERHFAAPTAPSVKTAKVEVGKITARVTATGVLSALVTVQVGSQVSGRIQEIHADFNSPVKKGQLIAKIDPQLYQAAVEQAKANDLSARAAVQKSKAQALDSKRQYDRAKALRERSLIAQADCDTAETNSAQAEAGVAVAESAVEQAKAALHQAMVNLEYTNIISPTNGVVISRNVDVGQTVAASFQAPVLFTIAEDLQKMQVDTNVAEADVGKLKAGMDATFRVDSYPTETFHGTIRQIRNAPQTIQNVVTYDAVIDVSNEELRLKPGMTANVTVVYDQRDRVLKIPNTALRFKPPPDLIAASRTSSAKSIAEGEARGELRPPRPTGTSTTGAPDLPDRRTVYVKRGLQVAPVPVRIGLSDGSFTEIVEGALKAGDLVVVEAKADEKSPAGARPGGGGGGFRRMF
jgi:HlyD family secretion protein